MNFCNIKENVIIKRLSEDAELHLPQQENPQEMQNVKVYER